MLAVAFLTYLVALGLASSLQQPDTGHLAAKIATAGAPWKAALEASISSLVASGPSPLTHVPAAVISTSEHDIGAAIAQVKATGTVMGMPVEKKISLQEMDRLIRTLSPGCGEHFERVLDGKDKLHTFGSRHAAATAQNCVRLGGTLCSVDARIDHHKLFGLRKRTTKTAMSAQGDSCLPRECAMTSDLHSVADFMQRQALAIIPGDQHEVELSVDCSKYGGSSVTVRSGTTLMGPTALALLAAVVLSIMAS